MELAAVRFGSGNTYYHLPTGRFCYVVCNSVDDGAALVVELFDADGLDHSGELRFAEASELGIPGGGKAVADVSLERARQIHSEGRSWTHDDKHIDGSLAQAAACYVLNAQGFAISGNSSLWPWEEKSFKPKGRRRDLVRAAALLVAEIERIDRAATTPVLTSNGRRDSASQTEAAG